MSYVCSAFSSVLIMLSMMASATAESRTYGAICEASAAALVDTSHVAIASDDYEEILTYQRGKPEPVARYYLGDDVTDIEAAARIGDVSFWVSSHSLNKDGEDKKRRKVLFGLRISGDGTLSDHGRKYRDLREDLAAALQRAEPRLMPSLNIEGMTDTPDGHLLLGLRGPQTMPADKAILVEVANPEDLIASESNGARAHITRVVTLDLSDGTGTAGRGVRDVARVRDRYLIIAGSELDGGVPAPKLFWWDGKSDKVTAGPEADFSGMTPEAVVVWNEREGEVFGDNGGAVIDGVECKDKSPPTNAFFPALDIEF